MHSDLTWINCHDRKRYDVTASFISKRGNPLFAADPGRLRVAAQLEPRFHVEVNLSANHLRNFIRDLLKTFAIPETDITIYLRQDRDAEHS